MSDAMKKSSHFVTYFYGVINPKWSCLDK